MCNVFEIKSLTILSLFYANVLIGKESMRDSNCFPRKMLLIFLHPLELGHKYVWCKCRFFLLDKLSACYLLIYELHTIFTCSVDTKPLTINSTFCLINTACFQKPAFTEIRHTVSYSFKSIIFSTTEQV